MKNLFSTLIILILILSCKKDGDNPPSPYSPSTYSIEGKWIYDLNAISNVLRKSGYYKSLENSLNNLLKRLNKS